MLTDRCRVNRFERRSIAKNSELGDQRLAFRQQPGLTFVHRDEFCQLLLSFKKLVRSDEPSVRFRGLLDVESGERYLIEQEELFAGCT
jgi:hypothetical protein